MKLLAAVALLLAFQAASAQVAPSPADVIAAGAPLDRVNNLH